MFWVTILLILIGLYHFKIRTKEKVVTLQKPFPQKDVVYLVQFPPSPKIRSISPFSLKLETYLRLKKVRYEPVYSLKFSQKGQIPYIELNGEQIADSNVIIKVLEEKGIAEKDPKISEDQRAITHLIR